MHDSTSILNLVLGSIFIGFGFVIPIVALLKTSGLTKLKFKELFILTAVQAVRVSGIIYFVLFLVELIISYYSNDYTLFLSMTPPWVLPLAYLLLSQLFWIRKVYMNKVALVTLAITILISPLLFALWFYYSFIRSFGGGEYIATSPLLELNYTLLGVTLNIIVFIFIIITIMLAGNKFKHIRQ